MVRRSLIGTCALVLVSILSWTSASVCAAADPSAQAQPKRKICRQSSDCDDKNSCTLDWCDVTTGCVHRSTNKLCRCSARKKQFAFGTGSPLTDVVLAVRLPVQPERVAAYQKMLWSLIERTIPAARPITINIPATPTTDAAGVGGAKKSSTADDSASNARYSVIALDDHNADVMCGFTSDVGVLNRTLERLWSRSADVYRDDKTSISGGGDNPIDFVDSVLNNLLWISGDAQTTAVTKGSESVRDKSIIFRDGTSDAGAFVSINHILLVVDPPTDLSIIKHDFTSLKGSKNKNTKQPTSAARNVLLNTKLDLIGRQFTVAEIGLPAVLRGTTATPVHVELERVIGRLGADDHYRDGWSGFNKALTLDHYDVRAGEEKGGGSVSSATGKTYASVRNNPLQARLLRNRNYCRVIEAERIAAAAISPAVLDRALRYLLPPHPSQYEWCSECQTERCVKGSGCQSTPKACPAGQRCFPASGLGKCRPTDTNANVKIRGAPSSTTKSMGAVHAPPADVVYSPRGQHTPLIREAKPTIVDVAALSREQGGPTAWTKQHIVRNHSVPIIHWSQSFENRIAPGNLARYLIDEINAPVIIRNSSVVTKLWRAHSKWVDWSYLESVMRSDTGGKSTGTGVGKSTRFEKVKTTDQQWLVYDMDQSAAMTRFQSPDRLDTRVHYQHVDFTPSEFFAKITNPEPDRIYYYFGNMTDGLKADLTPRQRDFLYYNDYDADRAEQYLWISSRGPCMHTHFDNDRNMFYQVVGEKRFTLWSPTVNRQMYPYPRNHPLWHKSQVHFNRPDLNAFPDYATLATDPEEDESGGGGGGGGGSENPAQQAILTPVMYAHLYPGDILYIPPYWWHHVESLTASVSLSTWSRYEAVAEAMASAWGKGLTADAMKQWRDQVHTLRLFIDMLVTDLVGKNRVEEYMYELVRTRYGAAGVREIFPHSDRFAPPEGKGSEGEGEEYICSTFHVSQSTLKSVEFDVRCVAQSFRKLPAEIRDFNLADYIEQVSVDIVGIRNLYAFFRFCFVGASASPPQRYINDESAKAVEEIATELYFTAGGKRFKLSEYHRSTHNPMFSAQEKADYEKLRDSYWRPTDIPIDELTEYGRL